MNTTETFTALYESAPEAVKQRLADVVLGARLATEGKENNGDFSNDSQGDSRVHRDRREVTTQQEAR